MRGIAPSLLGDKVAANYNHLVSGGDVTMTKMSLMAATTAVALALAGQPAAAFQIVPSDATVAGKSIPEWTGEWWSWVVSAPVSSNPNLDETGAFANVDNNRPVFFIAGTFGGDAQRQFKIEGHQNFVLIPLVNTAWIGWPPDTVQDALDGVNQFQPLSWYATIDGEDVGDDAYLVDSGFFTVPPVTADSLAADGGAPTGIPLEPSLSRGYWLMIEGLEPGVHTIAFGSRQQLVDGVLELNVVDTVFVPEPGSALLMLPALLGLYGARRRRQQAA